MDSQLAQSVQRYDELITSSLAEFVHLSERIGGLVKAQADIILKAVNAQRQFLVVASMSKKPNQDILMLMLKPTAEQITSVQQFREANRSSTFFNHLSAISESITALSWVTVSPAPAPFVKEMMDASQFYANKVLMAYKDKDKTHVDWAKAWVAFLSDLQKYVKEYHTTGLVWNVTGLDQSLNLSSPFSSGIPPPPPPPPPSDYFASDMGSKGGDEARLALMKELNIGTGITQSLRKVTADQQVHKNPALRTGPPLQQKSAVIGAPMKTTTVAPISKLPRFELEGRKWMLEYQFGKKDLVINSMEMSQSVSIYKCQDCVIVVKGKVNSITVDSCSKLGVVFDDIVSFVEFINCQNVQAQSMGSVPTINVEKTDVAQIYLSKYSITSEIVTAKSSSVNVSVPDHTGEFIEHALPEQFKSIWTGKGFKTEPTDKV